MPGQDERLIAVHTPLGEGVFGLTSFSGREELSRLFDYRLNMTALKGDIDPKALVGKPVSFSLRLGDGGHRWFHGHVRRLTRDADAQVYSAAVVPWLWFLTRTSDCRVFQNQSVVEIIKQVFQDFGFHDCTTSDVRGEHPPRTYCVQYRETAFDFVSRLMEEEGIFYYFHHEKNKHTLVLADQGGAYQDVEEKLIEFASAELPRDQVSKWERQLDYRSGAWAHVDYNFETPDISLAANRSTVVDLADSKFEAFDYPGAYQDKAAGDVLAQMRIEELEADHDSVLAESSYRTLNPGQVFDLVDSGSSSDAGGSYAIVWVEHGASSETYGTAGGGGGETYGNSFGCIPKSTPFRPQRMTPKPTIRGPQTAVVVGPNGEEVYTDEFGRIKVQFHWDRKGEKDENSSCWIRVGQVLAGQNWGGLFIPRVGQEVIVEFLDGDPDRPLVTGAVYNANNKPPWKLPGEKAKSGFESRSCKKGAKANASSLIFDDTKDSELVALHAEKDALHEVENDDQIVVGNDQTIKVEANRATEIETGDDSLTISKGSRTTKISAGKDTIEAAQGVEIKVGQSSLTLTPDAIEMTIGSSSIKLGPTNLDIASTFTAVAGELTAEVKGLVATVEADTALTLQGTIVNIN